MNNEMIKCFTTDKIQPVEKLVGAANGKKKAFVVNSGHAKLFNF